MNLIASVLELSRRDVQALRITDPYSLHRVVYSLYEDVRSPMDKARGGSSGILWADRGGDIRGRQLLLLANRPPADRVDGQHGIVRSQPIPKGFLTHKRYGFKTIINPVRRNNASRKIVPVKGRDAIAGWFLERGPKSWGFQPDPRRLQVGCVQVLQFKDKASRPVTLAQAHLEGELEVTDPEQFARSFANGIGRGRAFGCGLMQLFPLTHQPFV